MPLANRWQARLGLPGHFPPAHPAFLQHCHDAGQQRPTPLLLQYGPGDYNCLHQDLYGEHVFPLQVAILLSAPELDFTGGELVLAEQRPMAGVRGDYRGNLRQGVSRLHSGQRHTLGVIFHDAQ